MIKRFKNCQKIGELMILAEYEPLTFTQKVFLRLHLWACPECHRFQLNNQQLSKIIQKHKNGSS